VTYRIEFTRAALRQLSKLQRRDAARVLSAIEALASDPRPIGVKKLVGEDNAWRIRIGDHRVIYEIHDGRLLVVVFRVGHRKDVYE
jgi:mRNA interferase RelE/StbE